ncbi:MAG TPA: alpha,alpha-trehalase TreF [Saprospiraceae bacterium]|nr:alpha,alpha-trehalase TreF [Saprospiraceae bacterium]
MIYLTLPEETYPSLFKDAAMASVLADGKILADAIPLFVPDEINLNYESRKDLLGFNLLDFLKEHFTFGGVSSSDFVTNKSHSIEEHIDTLWPFLTRDADVHIAGSSLISLPYKYVVPGGRFNEIYYWDSYFTMLGLRVAGKYDLIESMIDNFAYLISEIGFIPNGNRSYFLSRSQPPFFAMMVALLVEIKGNDVYAKYLNVLQKEYDFWMDGRNKISDINTVKNHVVRVGENQYLNRYWDQLATPRSEMYRDDVHLASHSHREQEALYSDLRGACESGWDFSSRWCERPLELDSIKTSSILPVDLNCLMYNLEVTLSKAYAYVGQQKQSFSFEEMAEIRKALIQKYFWNEEDGYYFDYQFKDKVNTGSITAAGIFPLAFGIADDANGKQCLRYLREHLLAEGGILTTTIESGQQWDAPNGWAPLQWMAFRAALNYGDDTLASEISDRWTKLLESTFQNTGKLMEKYNVVNTNLESGGGEYSVQDGFGWTNGVYMAMVDWMKGQ